MEQYFLRTLGDKMKGQENFSCLAAVEDESGIVVISLKHNFFAKNNRTWASSGKEEVSPNLILQVSRKLFRVWRESNQFSYCKDQSHLVAFVLFYGGVANLISSGDGKKALTTTSIKLASPVECSHGR